MMNAKLQLLNRAYNRVANVLPAVSGDRQTALIEALELIDQARELEKERGIWYSSESVDGALVESWPAEEVLPVFGSPPSPDEAQDHELSPIFSGEGMAEIEMRPTGAPGGGEYTAGSFVTMEEGVHLYVPHQVTGDRETGWVWLEYDVTIPNSPWYHLYPSGFHILSTLLLSSPKRSGFFGRRLSHLYLRGPYDELAAIQRKNDRALSNRGIFSGDYGFEGFSTFTRNSDNFVKDREYKLHVEISHQPHQRLLYVNGDLATELRSDAGAGKPFDLSRGVSILMGNNDAASRDKGPEVPGVGWGWSNIRLVIGK